MLGDTRYDNGQTVFLPSIDDVARRGPLICATNNVNSQCCRGEHTPGSGGIGEWFYNDTLVKVSSLSGMSNLYRNRSLQQVVLIIKDMILPAGIYRCVVPDTTGQDVSATITFTNGETFLDHVCIHAHTCT